MTARRETRRAVVTTRLGGGGKSPSSQLVVKSRLENGNDPDIARGMELGSYSNMLSSLESSAMRLQIPAVARRRRVATPVYGASVNRVEEQNNSECADRDFTHVV